MFIVHNLATALILCAVYISATGLRIKMHFAVSIVIITVNGIVCTLYSFSTVHSLQCIYKSVITVNPIHFRYQTQRLVLQL